MKMVFNPEGLPHHPAFSQAIAVRDPSETIYVSGQNAVAPDGSIVGGTLREQSVQTLENVEVALSAAGASIDDVVRWTITIVDGQSVEEGYAAFAERYPAISDPPTISVQIVAGLADPRYLVEIDAIAVR